MKAIQRMYFQIPERFSVAETEKASFLDSSEKRKLQ
jgi:hypothetical protein